MFTVPSPLPDDPSTLRQLLLAAMAEIERQRLQIAALQRNRFGRRSEQLNDETLAQGLEDLEQSVAEQTAGLEAVSAAVAPPAPDRPDREPARRNRGALPPHLPRVEVTADIEDKTCPHCGSGLHRIGADTSEMLDYVPAQFQVRVIHRPRYGCRTCTDGVAQAPAPDRPSPLTASGASVRFAA